MTAQARIPPSRQREKPRGDFRWIGQSMKRVEDPRLLAGQGRYIDDVVLPNMLHAAALRSPHAHARIKSIDVSRAQALPGVALVMTGADVAKVHRALALLLPTRRSSSAASRSSACATSASRSRSSPPRAATSPRTRSS